MDRRLSPLAIAITSSLLLTTNAWSEGGASVAPAAGMILTWDLSLLSFADPGGLGINAGGSNGASTMSPIYWALQQGLSATNPGDSGVGGSNGRGGGGNGGVGGGSAFAVMSIGGAGGYTALPETTANGGDGGAISNITLGYDGPNTLSFIGTAGGAGGQGGQASATGLKNPEDGGSGAGGAGGAGGGSVFAAFSQGGAGGHSESSVNGVAYGSGAANGGHGGVLSAITVNLNNLTLSGGSGGEGGDAGQLFASEDINGHARGIGSGGGGAGGAGGGSVFAAFSQGGSGGFTPTYYGGASPADGGAGGNLSNITLTLSNAILRGAEGGSGGKAGFGSGTSAQPERSYGQGYGSGGAGGAGGGSVFAAFSQGGAGGFATSADGGAGGSISTINLSLNQVTLTGAQGGAGGQAGSGTGSLNRVSTGYGSGGTGGVGGGSVFAAFSQGGAGGYSMDSSLGGAGGDISAVNLNLNKVTLIGAVGGIGGRVGVGVYVDRVFGGLGTGGAGGAGGGSVFAAFSQGGTGGVARAFSSSLIGPSNGGAGGAISDITLTLDDVILTGAQGGAGGQGGYGTGEGYAYAHANGGAGGAGGGSVFAAFNQGGSAGTPGSGAEGGAGGAISAINLHLTGVTLNGALGGLGGQASTNAYNAFYNGVEATGNGGAGGAGGGSVFGAFSQGGAGGPQSLFSNGGHGGAITGVTLSLTDVTLNGAQGGNGGQAAVGSNVPINSTLPSVAVGVGGAGGVGGGAVFAGYSQGGAGGNSKNYVDPTSAPANGGNGGPVSGSLLTLTDVRLFGATGGAGGAGATGSTISVGINGMQGMDGGSIFGGYSAGGNGGISFDLSMSSPANGGQGGDTSNNTIRLSGSSILTGSIYGGYTQGGNAGIKGVDVNSPNLDQSTAGLSGQGGDAINNRITLVGSNLNIGGGVYGGFSLDGNVDFVSLGYSSLNNSKTFSGNTLSLEEYRGSVEGIYNFEFYDWILPANLVNHDVLINIRGNDLVDLSNTKHTVSMLSDGNRLSVNDEIVLIDKAKGAYQSTQTEVKQGYFLTYDATLDINNNDEFVLRITSKDQVASDPRSLITPAGRLNPSSKAFLEARAAVLGMVNQGADMVSEQLTECATDVFAIGDGGSSRYNTGSSVKVSDQRLAIGGRSCFDLPDSSQLMLGLFAEHGTGNYHSRERFADVGRVRGHGDMRYTGAGLVAHIDYAGTGTGVATVPVLASKDGLYNDAVLRAGNVKTDFASNQLIDADGKRAEYKSKSHYASAMLGVGYVWNFDSQQQVDLYGRYTWDRLASDKVKIGGDEVRFGTDHSSRLRIGTRYHYAVTPAIAPYAGIAYEHEFDGKASGKVFEFDIDQPELKGSSGVLEVGVTTHPFGNDSHWHFDAGVQGYFGTRKGATGSLSVKYDF